MAVHVDASVPVHPLTVDDVEAMVSAGILGENDHVELLDGVLVEMSQQGLNHDVAIRRLTKLLTPVVATARTELEVSPLCPLNVVSPISQPEPDIAVIPAAGWGAPAQHALLVIEVSVTSRLIDLGRKAAIYAAAAIPEYWVLDLEGRRLVVHRDPAGDRYETVDALTDAATVTAARLAFTVAVADLLPPAGDEASIARGAWRRETGGQNTAVIHARAHSSDRQTGSDKRWSANRLLRQFCTTFSGRSMPQIRE